MVRGAREILLRVIRKHYPMEVGMRWDGSLRCTSSWKEEPQKEEGRKEEGRIKGRHTKVSYLNKIKRERRGGLNPSSTPKFSRWTCRRAGALANVNSHDWERSLFLQRLTQRLRKLQRALNTFRILFLLEPLQVKGPWKFYTLDEMTETADTIFVRLHVPIPGDKI